MTTSAAAVTRPAEGEFAPYFSRYIDRVPDGDVVERLERQIVETEALLAGVGEARAGDRYAPGKWSVKEVVGHLSDTERVMSYRLLRIARGDATPLPGFEQDDYVRAAGFDRLALADLVAELLAVRRATLALLRGLDDVALARRGTVNGAPMSARALTYIIAGHELHHAAILRQRYLGGVD